MPRPSQKDTIVEAALHCFATQGYAATSIRDIAAGAGVSEAALYRHYKSKQKVAQLLFAEHLQGFALRMQAVVDTPEAVDVRLRQVVRLSLKIYRENPDAFTFVLLKTPDFMTNLPPDTLYPMDLLEGLMREGQAAGIVREGQANVLAAILFGCILRPIVLSQLADPGSLDLLDDTSHDEVILQAAVASVSK